jgi:thiol-disulfide isomerase/thioredoxin
MSDSPAPEPGKQSPQQGEDALSRTLLVVGLVLVVGAIAVYHFSPEFKLQPPKRAGVQDQGAGPAIQIPVPAIRGTVAPMFELPDVNGKIVRLADFKGKIVLVNFWATWCGPCLTEIPWFLEFKERYGSQGFDVIAVNIFDEDKTAVMPFIVKNNMRSLNVVIASEELDEQFGGFSGLPYTFLVDREGKFFSKHIGLVAKEDVEDEIVQLLSDTPPAAKPAEAEVPAG